jgi:hypothetical protein
MGARWYDSRLGIWTSADTLVPNPEDPKSLNRYSWVLGNPLRYADPSGHDPLDAAWEEEFRNVHGRDPTWEDILIRLFSIAFPEEWDNSTWNALYMPDGQIRAGAIRALFQRPPEGRDWAGMPESIGQMTSWYHEGETAEFIRDIGTLFGGLGDRSESNSLEAITGGRPHGVSVWIRQEGLPEELLGSDATGNVHHWAWTLNLGYFTGRAAGRQINSTRERSGSNQCDANCRADLALGTIGADMGSFMSRGLLPSRSPNEFQNAWQLMPALQVSVQ